jgi:hypothetical protein
MYFVFLTKFLCANFGVEYHKSQAALSWKVETGNPFSKTCSPQRWALYPPRRAEEGALFCFSEEGRREEGRESKGGQEGKLVAHWDRQAEPRIVNTLVLRVSTLIAFCAYT